MIAISDPLFDAVCRILVRCRGEKNALTLAQIAAQVNASRREVEDTIEHNLASLPFLLVAGAKGIYIPTSAADIERYLHSLHSRHRRMQLREAIVRRKARAAGFPEEAGHFVNPPQALQQELFQ